MVCDCGEEEEEDINDQTWLMTRKKSLPHSPSSSNSNITTKIITMMA